MHGQLQNRSISFGSRIFKAFQLYQFTKRNGRWKINVWSGVTLDGCQVYVAADSGCSTKRLLPAEEHFPHPNGGQNETQDKAIKSPFENIIKCFPSQLGWSNRLRTYISAQSSSICSVQVGVAKVSVSLLKRQVKSTSNTLYFTFLKNNKLFKLQTHTHMRRQ